jgi:phage terminase Nu1 subunit (DNA packaging protein)
MSLNQLVELTGKTFRTVKKRLAGLRPVREDGRAEYYDTKEALQLLYPQVQSELAKENLLLERARREKEELKLGEMKGELIPVAEVVKAVEREYNFVRSQIRNLPSKMAKPLSMTADANDVFELLQEAVNECLTELTVDEKYKQKLDDINAKKATEETPEEPDDDEKL